MNMKTQEFVRNTRYPIDSFYLYDSLSSLVILSSFLGGGTLLQVDQIQPQSALLVKCWQSSSQAAWNNELTKYTWPHDLGAV